MISFLFILTLVISFAVTLIVRRIALKKNLLDIPNDRSSHSEPTPRGGGVAILIAWYFGLLWLYYFKLIEPHLFFALISGFVLAFVSFMDDVFTLKPWIRILIQLLTVLSGLYFIGGVEIVYLNDKTFFVPVALNIFIIIGAVWFINLYNFLDGIDGYASIEAISIAIGIFIIVGNPVLLLLVFSVLGFLIWNWPKAKIFMGDVGSTQLGYILVILGIYFNNTMELNILGWMILTSLFWVDATLTLLRRWRNKEKLSVAHKKHAYQRIVQFGFTHRKTIIISIFINLLFILFVLLSERYDLVYLFTFPVCILFNYLIIKYIDSKVRFQKDSLSEEL